MTPLPVAGGMEFTACPQLVASNPVRADLRKSGRRKDHVFWSALP